MSSTKTGNASAIHRISSKLTGLLLICFSAVLTIPELKAELEGVGLNDVLAECQKQLNEFLGK